MVRSPGRWFICALCGIGSLATAEDVVHLADDTFATVTLGDLCVAQGLTDEATAIFSRIALRQPDHAIARARLAELGRPRSPARRPRG